MFQESDKEATSLIKGNISTGIKGLDEVLLGGFIPGHSYMLRGGPGTGKTTIGLQFLSEGARAGEPVLFISLEETEKQIRTSAEKLGLDLTGVSFLDLSPDSAFFAESQSYDIFSSAEVEREPLSKSIVTEVERLRPKRVFIDPLTQFRYLATDRFQFHRQVLSLMRFLSEHGATVLMTSETSPEAPDFDVQFLVHCVIQLKYNNARAVSQLLSTATQTISPVFIRTGLREAARSYILSLIRRASTENLTVQCFLWE